ncbi:hypothetical protein [Amycolatopsis decaplanina]|nr:hypothetical protein [Amycolatopsis decaplanina]
MEGASLLASVLREAGPEAEVWVPFHYRTASFCARALRLNPMEW